MPFKKNDPNINRAGRPKKDRALTAILERAGGKTVEIDGKNISGRQLMARQVWEGITTGHVSFPGETKKIILSPQDWKDLVKWAYSHIDGPPQNDGALENIKEVIIRYADSDNPTETS